MNLVDIFEQTAARQPDHVAVFGPGRDARLTYRELQQRIRKIAGRFEAAGIRAGDCVGLHYPSGIDYIILTYALWCCGACSVPIAVELAEEEKHEICRGICLSGVITPAARRAVFTEFQLSEASLIDDTAVFLKLRQSRLHPPGFPAVNAAFLRFTSGTTGGSKGVVLSHECILDRIHAANDGLCLGPEDRVIWLLSMSYHFAVSIVAYLSFGCGIVLCANHFGPTIVQTTARLRGTVIYGSPVHFELMANDTSDEMLDSVRLAISTAMSLKRETAEAYLNRFGKPLNEAYGIIEVGLPCINIDGPLEHGGSVGRPLPAYEISLKNIGLGEDLKAIHLRGKGFFDAYYDPWQPREALAADGWFATGDLGRLDRDGYLYIGGRSKEVINVGGMKFFPQEVEQLLESYPGVKEACVFAYRHSRFGEVPHAHIVLEANASEAVTESELKKYCSRHLASFKVPDSISQVDSLARTASGKIIRDASRVAS